MKYNFEQVFNVFDKNYELVPLEIFGNDPYKTLVSTVLSARTRDEVTLKVSEKLFEKAPDFKSLSNLTEDNIKELIKSVGFYKTKAKHLKLLAIKIISDYKNQVPQTREELMSLPGVGRKTANLVLNRAFNIPAIAVDTHVHKISNLLGWVKTKTTEQTENELVRILPKKYWSDMNRLFVSIGRKFNSQKRVLGFLIENKLV